jgi:membrane protein DedA with SNARE-associated domain
VLVTPALAAAALPAALNALPTAAAVAVLCVAVVAEIVMVPAVLLPGGTMTLLAGALIGAGRPALGGRNALCSTSSASTGTSRCFC